MTEADNAGMLDLKRCRPDEYEGKTVVVNGASYRIGPFIGQGAEKIVHTMTNLNSGLTLHVIKIYRNQRSIAVHAARDRLQYAEFRRYFTNSRGSHVPDELLEQSHNGWFLVQDAAPFLLLPPLEPTPLCAKIV